MASPTSDGVDDQVWLSPRRSSGSALLHDLPHTLASAPSSASGPAFGGSGTRATVPNMDEAAWVASVFTGRPDPTAQLTAYVTPESSRYNPEPVHPYVERTYSTSSLLRGLDDPFCSWPNSGEDRSTHWTAVSPERYAESPPIHREMTVSLPSLPQYVQVAAPIPAYADSYYGGAETVSGHEHGHVHRMHTHFPPSIAPSVGSTASSPHVTPILSGLGAIENSQLLYPEDDKGIYDASRTVANGLEHLVSDGEPFSEDDMDLGDDGWVAGGPSTMDVPHRYVPADDEGAPAPGMTGMDVDSEVRVDIEADPLDCPTAAAQVGAGDLQCTDVDACPERETSLGLPKRSRRQSTAISEQIPLRRSMRLQTKAKLTSPPASPNETGLRRRRLQEKARDHCLISRRMSLVGMKGRRRTAGIARSRH
ncbi:hypothetical protein LXA43DRAFT_1102715 [Ganoderma leucocontextum]|nr:hypothetical protein LXA43DRAFT_1102715 [Ganoderma leucocontextum]